MGRKQKIELIIIAIVLLGIAFVMDRQEEKVIHSKVSKPAIGEGSTQMDLVIEGAEEGEKYDYELKIQERTITELEAQELFEAARQEVDATLYYEDEDASDVHTGLKIQDSYVDKKVQAQWWFDNSELVSYDGEIIPEGWKGIDSVVNAEVVFEVQGYEEIYQFSFVVKEPFRNKREELLYHIEQEIKAKESDSEVFLPDEVDGVPLKWKIKKENLFGKILLLEIIVFVSIVFAHKKSQSNNQERERTLMEFDYSEIVGKYAILLGAGMAPKQVWYTVTASYLRKRKENKQRKRRIYEEMAKTYYELQDGQYEAEAYQKFGKRVNLPSYNRFVRLLNQSNTKGARGISMLLQQEASAAFGERVAMARKLGEEASTKLLFPLILMMMVLFAIIIAPAIIEFL